MHKCMYVGVCIGVIVIYGYVYVYLHVYLYFEINGFPYNIFNQYIYIYSFVFKTYTPLFTF